MYRLETDRFLFASLPGGQAVIDWFGFCPSFHDGTLERLELSGGGAELTIRTYRITGAVELSGAFVCDRHASVTLRMAGVTGLKLDGDAGSIISDLVVRRLEEDPPRAEWQSCSGPIAGNIEVSFSTAVGLYGSIFAKELAFDLLPCGASDPAR